MTTSLFNLPDLSREIAEKAEQNARAAGVELDIRIGDNACEWKRPSKHDPKLHVWVSDGGHGYAPISCRLSSLNSVLLALMHAYRFAAERKQKLDKSAAIA